MNLHINRMDLVNSIRKSLSSSFRADTDAMAGESPDKGDKGKLPLGAL
jgi:hypothetical protein